MDSTNFAEYIEVESRAGSVLEGLDSEQKAAVSQTEGPVLIVAGAGAGKTRVLTSRIAYILGQGAEPDRILALTFTKKAAGEMKERIAAMVGIRKARRLYMGTFHSVFIRFLREFADSLGYPASFTIYDTGDSISAIKHCLKDLELDDKVYKPKEVLNRISMAKNNLVTAETYARNQQAIANDTHAKKPEIHRIYSLYAAKCRQAGVMDFDDILLNMNILLRDNPEALTSISGRFDYIMVDEYQDTNYAQYLILKKLGMTHRNVCVVGDDSQSIYAFRGAKIENILNFQKDYPECKVFRLEQNYRSTQTIVGAANSVIERNASRIPKKCFSKGLEGDRIHLIKAYTELEEARLIVSSIVSVLVREHCQYQDIAILYRTNSQSRAIEEALRKRNLPYKIYSGNSFFEREEVKDMMAYLKLAVNPNDNESFRRVLNKPARGIGATSENALVQIARSVGLSFFDACSPESVAVSSIKSGTAGKIMEFRGMVAEAHSRLMTDDAYTIASFMASRSGILSFYRSDNSVESQAKAANVEELLNNVKTFVEERQNQYKEELLAESDVSDVESIDSLDAPVVTLGEFLEDISLLSAVDMADDGDSANRIALMTVHSSKGLEFPYVYVAGMEENIFPSGGMLASPSDIEEERRLFYVALTRAKIAVNLSFAATRMRNGKHEANPPSRFLKEIDSQYIDNPLRNGEQESGTSFGGFGSRFSGFGRSAGGASGYGKPLRPVSQVRMRREIGIHDRKPSVSQSGDDKNFAPVSVLELRAGQRIEHNRFGFGIIVSITGNGSDLKAKILFDSHGEKILLLKYAKIRVVHGES